MRKTISICFFLFCLSVIRAQDTAVAFVKYTLTHVMDTTQRDNPLVRNYILHLGANNKSSYGTDRNAPVSNASFAGGGGGMIIARSVPMGSASLPSGFNMLNNQLKDLNANKMSTINLAGQQVYSVEESIPVIEWNITQDTKEIMGLQCQKATGDFKGRKYEAWFTSQLPYSNGPWKLGGLPGLIIEAADTKKEVVFKFVSFEKMNGPKVSLDIPNDVLKVSPKEFKQYQDAVQRDREAANSAARGAVAGDVAAVGSVRVVSGSLSGGAVGPDGKPIKPRVMNNPIELEPVKK